MTKPTKVTQEEVNQVLWKACDTFRGILNSADYKNYILPMLFLNISLILGKKNMKKSNRNTREMKSESNHD